MPVSFCGSKRFCVGMGAHNKFFVVLMKVFNIDGAGRNSVLSFGVKLCHDATPIFLLTQLVLDLSRLA
jgi:hypothetical protein